MLAAGLVDEGQDDGRDQPASRVGRHEDQEVAVSGKYGVQPGDADAADTDQDDDSRRQGIAIAAQGSGDDVDDAIEVERPGDVKEALRPQGDDVRVAVEQADEFRRKEEDRHGDDQEERRFDAKGDFGDAEAAAQVAGAIVLANEGRRRLAEAVDETVDIVFDDEGRSRRCHGFRPQAVQGRLDEDVGQGKDHALDAGRQADVNNVMQFFPGKAQVVAFQADAVRRPAQQDQEDERIDGKGHNRRPDDAGQAEIKDQDRQQVEDDIDEIGCDQAVQRRPAIAAAAEDGRLEVIQRQKRQAQQEDAQILFGHIVDVWRHFQDPEGRIDDEFADDSQHQAQAEGHQNSRLDRPFHLVVATGTEILGNGDVGPQGNPHEQRHQKADDRHIVANSSHGALADEASQNKDVGTVEELFK